MEGESQSPINESRRYDYDPHGHVDWSDKELKEEKEHIERHLLIGHSAVREAQLLQRLELAKFEQKRRRIASRAVNMMILQ